MNFPHLPAGECQCECTGCSGETPVGFRHCGKTGRGCNVSTRLPEQPATTTAPSSALTTAAPAVVDGLTPEEQALLAMEATLGEELIL